MPAPLNCTTLESFSTWDSFSETSSSLTWEGVLIPDQLEDAFEVGFDLSHSLLQQSSICSYSNIGHSVDSHKCFHQLAQGMEGSITSLRQKIFIGQSDRSMADKLKKMESKRHGSEIQQQAFKKYYKYLKNKLYLTNCHLHYKISVSAKHNL